MLSAIAARRAGRAHGAKANTLPEVADKASEETLSEPIPFPSKSKRRKMSQREPVAPKRQKTTQRPRYYEAPADDFGNQADIVILASDSDESLISDSEPEEITPIPKRPWSPSTPVADSSDDENNNIPPDDPRHPEIPPCSEDSDPLLSSFKPVLEQNLHLLSVDDLAEMHLPSGEGHSAMALGLLPSETVCLIGTYTVTVVHGCLTIHGVTLTVSSGTQRIFAAKSSPIPILECLGHDGTITNSLSILDRFRSTCQQHGCVVVVQELRTGVEGLGRVFKSFEGVFNVRQTRTQTDYDSSIIPGVHLVIRPSKDVQPFEFPPSWDASLSSLSATNDSSSNFPGIHMIKGPKNTGKSTFCMVAINRLLTRYRKVAYLECDLGQSEFTPGAMVALHVLDKLTFGPAFTHPSLPVRSHYIGATTPRSSPSQYLASIQSLMEFYRLDVETPALDFSDTSDPRNADRIPLVVNTMGWTKGLGADLMQSIESIVQPTHVYTFEVPENDSYTMATSMNSPALGSTTVHHVLQPISSGSSFLPTDHRTINMMSYLYAIFPESSSHELEQVTASSWDVSRPLCARFPYEVDCSIAFDRVILTGAGSEDVVPSELERVLNGAIVGLVSCDPDALESAEDMPSPLPSKLGISYIPGAPPPLPSMSTCHGLALVRSVSPQLAKIQVLTPIPPARLAQCRILVKGEQQLPIWGMLDFTSESGSVAGVEMGKIPYLQWGKGEGIGSERRRVRRNLMRRGQN